MHLILKPCSKEFFYAIMHSKPALTMSGKVILNSIRLLNIGYIDSLIFIDLLDREYTRF